MQFHNGSPHAGSRIYSEIRVQNINYLQTIQYSIRDCKIRQIIALVGIEQGFPILRRAIGSRRAAICGLNNLIIRDTEFTIQSVVPFVRFVFNMSIRFSYYCRIEQHSNTGFSLIEMIACVIRVRFVLGADWPLGWDLFKLHVLICRWIKHVSVHFNIGNIRVIRVTLQITACFPNDFAESTGVCATVAPRRAAATLPTLEYIIVFNKHWCHYCQ